VNFLENNYDLIILCGIVPFIDSIELLNDLQNVKDKNSKIVLLSPIEDVKLCEDLELFCKYEAGSEEGVVAMLSKYLVKELPKNLQEYFENLDDGYLSAETNIGEDEIEEIQALYGNAKNPLFIFGKDLVVHECSENIARFLNILKSYSRFEMVSLEKFEFTDCCETPYEVEDLKSFDGTAILQCKARNEKETNLLIGSAQFSIAAKSSNGQFLHVSFDGISKEREFVVDENLKGTIALMPMDEKVDVYRYKVAKITKREVQ
jgi:NADH-quinone oxidoreductase subunit F